MCFDPTADPPVPTGDPPARLWFPRFVRGGRPVIGAAAARAETAERAAVVVLPDGRGLHPYYERLVQRLAEHGSDAVAIDYTERSADGATTGPARWDDVLDTLGQAVGLLRAERADRPVVTVGFCLGGRLALLSASEPELGLAAAVGLYGQPFGPTRHDLPAPLDRIDTLCCPVTAIFGGADDLVPLADARTYEAALRRRDSVHEVVVYEGAPHSFFDRSSNLHAAASADVWRRLGDITAAYA